MADEATTTETKAPEAPKTTVIRVGGKDYTPEQLEQTMASQQATAASFRDATAALFDPSKTPQQREAGARSVLKNIGYSDQAIEEWVEVNVKAVDAAPEPKQQQPQNTDSEALKEVKSVQSEILNETFRSELNLKLEKDGEIANIMKHTERLRGKEAVTKAKETVGKELSRSAMDRIRARLSRTNERLTSTIVREEIGKAVTDVVGLFNSVGIADPSGVGRAAETSTTTGPKLKKVEPPKWKPGLTAGDLEKQATDFWTYELVELANQTSDKHSDSMV